MSKIKQSDELVSFYCPGCKDTHSINVGTDGILPAWGFNGSAEAPTFTPSVLVRGGHHLPGHTGRCWCIHNAERPHVAPVFKCEQCHSFVTDGRIQFLDDCSHALAGQTVDLPDY